LIEAQEEGRTRIARELHDDINQRLALLAVALSRLQENRTDLSPDVLSRMHKLRQQTTQISDDVQALAHDLHSSQMEHLGAVAGLTSWCKEFSERTGMEIDFRSSEAPNFVPSEIGFVCFEFCKKRCIMLLAQWDETD
jgi:signal transduction histidine kinase